MWRASSIVEESLLDRSKDINKLDVFHQALYTGSLEGNETAIEENLIIRFCIRSIQISIRSRKTDLQIRYNNHKLKKSILPTVMRDAIVQDAIQRDITTARRVALLEILWNERYLTRSQLIARVELRLGKNCFGISAWEDAFYRDMRFVKQAFEAEGYRLLYSRHHRQPGYYLDGEPLLSSELKQVLMGSAAEVDQRQIDIYRKLSFAERFHQGCAISDTARKVVAYRIRQENPRLSVTEANQTALQRAYSQ